MNLNIGSPENDRRDLASDLKIMESTDTVKMMNLNDNYLET